MTSATTMRQPSIASRISTRLSPRAAFLLQASITGSFLAGSNAPTPLYPIYQAAWGFSSITITVIFGIYALAVLSALLVFGRLSDHVGRRPVLMVATAVQVVAMALLGSADGLGGLLVGRVVQGLSVGAAMAAVGAGLLDIDRARGTVANAIAPIMGTATGALVAGLMVHYLPAPTHLVYVVLAVTFALQGLLVVRMTETNAPVAGAWRSLKPQFALPIAVRMPMAIATPMLVATWALAGFYASLGPRLVHTQFGLDASLAGGLTLFLLAASGGAGVLLMQNRGARAMTIAGALGLLVGAGLVEVSLAFDNAVAFFIGTVLAGLGFGAGFQGAIRSVVGFAAPHERAGVLSVAFVISYLAMGVPAIVAGGSIAEGASILATAREFGSMVMLLAAVALAGVFVHRPAVAR